MNLAWQNRVASTPIVKARNKIVLPAFNVFDYADVCHKNKLSYWNGVATAALLPNTGYTLEAWFMLGPGDIVNWAYLFRTAGYEIRILPDLRVYCIFRDAGGIQFTLSAAESVGRNTWNHVALTWDNTDNLMRCYINGVLSSVTVATVGNAYNTAGGMYRLGDTFNTTTAPLYINEFRVWDHKRTQEELLAHMYSPRDTIGDANAGLVGYYRFDEGVGGTVDNLITANPLQLTLTNYANGDPEWIDDDSYPRRYGANWCVAKFHTTMSKVSGFRTPIVLPSDANFALCVSAVDSNSTLTRYVLANPLSLKLPDSTIIYTGQRLPVTFTLEIWHKDGEPSTLLSAAVNLITATLRVVTTTDYGTLNADATIVIDEEIYTPFPLSFPLTFDQAR